MRRLGIAGISTVVVLSLGCDAGEEGMGTGGGEETLLVLNNRDYYGRVHSAIQHAKKSIHIAMYVMKYYPDEASSVNLLLEDLAEARSRGVDVRVVLEGSETVIDSSAVNYLEENGVSVSLDPTGVTTHAKLIVLDGETVVVGSTNWSNSALRSNNETNMEVKDPATAKLYEDYFQSLWEASIND